MDSKMSDSDIESQEAEDADLSLSPVDRRKPAYQSLPTGLVYDIRMRFHAEPIQHVNDAHPEDPRRIFVVYDELRQAGLVHDARFPELAGPDLLKRIPTRYATKDEILKLHTEEVWDFVMSLTKMSEEQLKAEGDAHDSVYLSVNTPMCALLAAGGAIEAARAVMNGVVKNSIAVIRPPGHHAEHHKVMGFCFFNNVPVAVRAIQEEYEDAARKILILDWDVHHGNGVQNMFYDDPNVLYISLHVDQGGSFYPNTEAQNHTYCGEGKGAGRNVNIPWSQTGMADGDYLYAFQQIVMPIAQAFDPDLVFVCAGFDAAEGDHIGGCHVSPAGFAHMTHMLKSLADGKLVVCMEGGYNLRSVAVSALAVTRTLMGEQPGRLVSTQASQSGAATVQMVLRQQAKYWPCLHMHEAQHTAETTDAQNMIKVIRDWQSNYLYATHAMMPLFIARDNLNHKFDYQVLSTPTFMEKRPLLIVFHDPPELIGGSYNKSGYLDPHNTWLTDPVKSYIDWAVGKGFAIIDVNIPFHHTSLSQPYIHQTDQEEESRVKDATQLITYIWENYVELQDAKDIFILGIGCAYEAILHLLARRNLQITALIRKIFFFICSNRLVALRKTGDNGPQLVDWFFEHTNVYIADEHPAVSGPVQVTANTRKKYGRCIASPTRTMGAMLQLHQKAVFEVLEKETAEWRAENAKMLDGEDVSMDGHD